MANKFFYAATSGARTWVNANFYVAKDGGSTWTGVGNANVSTVPVDGEAVYLVGNYPPSNGPSSNLTLSVFSTAQATFSMSLLDVVSSKIIIVSGGLLSLDTTNFVGGNSIAWSGDGGQAGTIILKAKYSATIPCNIICNGILGNVTIRDSGSYAFNTVINSLNVVEGIANCSIVLAENYVTESCIILSGTGTVMLSQEGFCPIMTLGGHMALDSGHIGFLTMIGSSSICSMNSTAYIDDGIWNSDGSIVTNMCFMPVGKMTCLKAPKMNLGEYDQDPGFYFNIIPASFESLPNFMVNSNQGLKIDTSRIPYRRRLQW